VPVIRWKRHAIAAMSYKVVVGKYLLRPARGKKVRPCVDSVVGRLVRSMV
jgi:hypothetical protein